MSKDFFFTKSVLFSYFLGEVISWYKSKVRRKITSFNLILLSKIMEAKIFITMIKIMRINLLAGQLPIISGRDF